VASPRIMASCLNWSSGRPTRGLAGVDAQDVINREIKPPDVLIVILWMRIGTPTGRAVSADLDCVNLFV
jgi:hypothetical protein